jgi:hypothetical protein
MQTLLLDDVDLTLWTIMLMDAASSTAILDFLGADAGFSCRMRA